MNTSQDIACAAALSTQTAAVEALEQASAAALDQLGVTPNLAFLFLSGHHAGEARAVAEQALARLGTDQLLGCTAESIAGQAQEIERRPALALWLAHLPDVDVTLMHVRFEQTPEGGSFVGWPESLPAEWPDPAALLLLGDPFSFPADQLLERLNEDHPDVPVMGGMASSAQRPKANRLLCGNRVYDEGAVAVLLAGLRLRAVVSQGCRPIGEPFVITKASRNLVLELGGVTAYERLKQVYQTLAAREQMMLQRGLHLGRVVNEYQDRFEQGDFLVRNVLGVDAETGALAIGDHVRPGQTVQFHIRDAETADAELRQLLAKAAGERDGPPRGALLFTCNGRGTRLFGTPHHDASAVEQAYGAVPLAGFFAAGELGPIGGKNFLHGFTASIALF
jgi:small ligand-binding sensory domain FIST